MLTLEKIAWVAIVLGLVIAVTAVIVKPIYNKADEQGKEITDIKFETTYHIQESPKILLEGEYYDYNRAA